MRGTLHWVSASHSVAAEVRLYGRLFRTERPSGDDLSAELDPESLEVRKGCRVEPDLGRAERGERFQFLRKGYFIAETGTHSGESPVFNRIISLKDSWGRVNSKKS